MIYFKHFMVFGKLYESLDNVIMTIADSSVKAWNFVTGKKKSHLANSLNASGCFMTSLGIYQQGIWPAIPILALCGYNSFQDNKKIEEKEERALESSVKDSLVGDYKSSCKKLGAIMASLSAATFLTEIIPQARVFNNSGTVFDYALGIGFGLIAAQNYVMRTEYLPSRRDCITRRLENLRETREEAYDSVPVSRKV
jgi:hypothetical protein